MQRAISHIHNRYICLLNRWVLIELSWSSTGKTRHNKVGLRGKGYNKDIVTGPNQCTCKAMAA